MTSLPPKKGTVPICRNGPKGASHKWGLSPFSASAAHGRDGRLARVALPGGAFARRRPARLEELVRTDPECCRQYVVFMQMHALAERFDVGQVANLPTFDQLQPSAFRHRPIPSPLLRRLNRQSPTRTSDPEPLIPPIIIDTSSALPSPYSAFGSSLGGWLVSYGVATVITGMAILGAWAYKVSIGGGTGILPARLPTQARCLCHQPAPELVGRISGMADCRWADPQDAPVRRRPLGPQV